jgi:hypothetical protein
MSTTEHLEHRIAEIRRRYKDELNSSDIAVLEDCSRSAAIRRMGKFEFGGLTRRNARDVRCYREGYVEYLRRKTVLEKVCA